TRMDPHPPSHTHTHTLVVIFVKSVQRCIALAQLLVEQNFPAIAIHRFLGISSLKIFNDEFLWQPTYLAEARALNGRTLPLTMTYLKILTPTCIGPPVPYSVSFQVAGRPVWHQKFGHHICIRFENYAKILHDVQDHFEVNISELPDEIDITSPPT
ncbi:hypothetical protein HPG69_012688, partial [Diceros bicornis minor]